MKRGVGREAMKRALRHWTRGSKTILDVPAQVGLQSQLLSDCARLI